VVGVELPRFNGCQSAGIDFNICASVQHSDFTYQKDRQGDFVLAFDETKMRESFFVQKVWNIDYQLRFILLGILDF
jgi:hypothetical protein